MDDGWATGSWGIADKTGGRITAGISDGSTMPSVLAGQSATVIREVVVQRSEGQIFRERVGFVILCIIGGYCSMRLLIDLKSILEPFLWSVALVMIGKPLVDALEKRLEVGLGVFCCWLRKELHSRGLHDDDDENSEMLHMLGDEEATPLGRVDDLQDDAADELDLGGSRCRSQKIACQDLDGDDDGFVETQKDHWRHVTARGLAILIALIMTIGLVSLFGLLVLESARHMRAHWDVYQKGAQNLTLEAVRILGYLFQKVPERMRARYEDVTQEVMTTAQDFLYGILGNFINNVSSAILGLLLTMLYTLFWLCSPIPMESSVQVILRRYLMFKTLACFGYGICVGMLLAFLSIDLAAMFALTTFILNYIPEVGSFIAMVLPCPLILLDSRLDRPFLVLMTAVLGQLALKFAFSNIIEVKLIESDKKLRMHPVIILLSVAMFGYLWGPTGMLLSVPLMAMLKISLFSDLVPASYRDPILVLLEGDRNAPRTHGLMNDSSRSGRHRRAPPGG